MSRSHLISLLFSEKNGYMKCAAPVSFSGFGEGTKSAKVFDEDVCSPARDV